MRNAFLSQIENGKVQLPNVDVLADVAKVYNLDLWNLMWRAGYRIPKNPIDDTEPVPEVPWHLLWDDAIARLDRLDLTADELDEVVDYAAFVKERGEHPRMHRIPRSARREIEYHEAMLPDQDREG